ncbi:MAG: chemotaxis protein CheB [Vulcanimicrobiota bacterium]
MKFPVVGIGASAGGLKPLEAFLEHVPSEPGMAFVIVQHAKPGHRSLLPELLSKHTQIPVVEIEDGMPIAPNTVYVSPPGAYTRLFRQHFQLVELASPGSPLTPIDFFFRSLAQEAGEFGAGLILSGTGSDGTLGLAAIKESGGVTAVQDPTGAEYDAMPRSALTAGVVDWTLAVEDMPSRLSRLLLVPGPQAQAWPDEEAGPSLKDLLLVLRTRTGHDFSLYKENTIRRRVERRMARQRIDGLAEYLAFLQAEPTELDRLSRELLIGVTSFFRDPDAFQSLEEVIASLLDESRGPDDVVRAWVPACSTGEEAYSIAMLLLERLEAIGRRLKVAVFASDIDASAIDIARRGIYPEGIALDVAPERLTAYFDKIGNSYHVRQRLRDVLIFAEQSLLNDPPFSRLDLISCRNLLIYLQPELQQRILGLFHYALKPGGILFLGNSETIGESDLFEVLDKRWKLFVKTDIPTPWNTPLSLPRAPAQAPFPAGRRPLAPVPDVKLSVQAALLERHCPTGVVVDHRGEVVYIHGPSGRFLDPPRGEATLNLMALAKKELRVSLMTSVAQVAQTGKAVSFEGIRLEDGGEAWLVDATVEPLGPGSAGSLLVVFRSRQAPGQSEEAASDGRRVRELESDLIAAQQYLRATIEELETSNEELKAANEELQSSNEELQSTNEELETSKEELQSLNEELTTVNVEFRAKNEDLLQTAADMTNLLSSTEIAMIFVGNDLSIVRFTPSATQVSHLIPSDVGRPLSDIAPRLDYDQARLVEDVREVLATLVSHEVEVTGRDGRFYSLRIMPYRTLENIIVGAVLTFVDITPQKVAFERALPSSLAAEHCPFPLLLTDSQGTVQFANSRYRDREEPDPAKLLGQLTRNEPVWEQLTRGRALTQTVYRSQAGQPVACTLGLAPLLDSHGALERLVVSEQETDLAQLFELAGGLLMVIDEQGRICRLNSPSDHDTGLSLGLSILDASQPEPAAEGRLFFLGQGEFPRGWEGSLQTSQGRQHFFFRRAILRDAAGQPVGLLCSGENVTLQRQAGRLFAKSRQLLTLLPILARTDLDTPEQELVANVCQTMVDRAGYTGAWVGFTDWRVPMELERVSQAGDPDPSEHVHPIFKAMLGRGEGSQRLLRPVSHSDDAHGRSITIPLSTEQDLLGVLHLCDRDPLAFGPEEIQLLTTYADALARAPGHDACPEAIRRIRRPWSFPRSGPDRPWARG